MARPSLRASTRKAIIPTGPPTDEIFVWTESDDVERHTAQAVIDLSMRAGVAMLSTGAAAADVTATVLLLTKAYGLNSVHVDVTYTSITVSYHRGPHADPITVMRIVRFRVQDFTRLERLRGLILELSRDPIDVDEALVRFDSLLQSPHPYRRWLVVVSGGALAAGAAGLVGGGPFIVLLSFVTATIVGRLLTWLSSAGVASFFGQCVGAGIPTVVATLVVIAQSAGISFFGDVSPSLVVAAGHRPAPVGDVGRRGGRGRARGLLRHRRGTRLRGASCSRSGSRSASRSSSRSASGSASRSRSARRRG